MEFNSIPELKEFPAYNSPDLSLYFREQIVFLFFNLTRKYDDLLIKNITINVRQVLQLLKKELYKNRDLGFTDVQCKYLEYLELIYKLIANTRDIFEGKGEHQLFYMLIYELYMIFPNLAVYMLYQIDKLGSWRDIKYLCLYVREHSQTEIFDGSKNSFINVCVELLNTKLNKDVVSLGENDSNNISTIAKWIPREKPRFEWLFVLLAIHWSNNYGCWKLKWTNHDNLNYEKALNKCKATYRKVISNLNKILDTTEIKQCSKKWHEIDPYRVSKYTAIKQPKLFLSNYHNIKTNNLIELTQEISKLKCSQNYIEKIKKNSFTNNYNDIIQLPVSYFVKEAFRIIKLSASSNYFNEECELLNFKWEQFSRHQSSYKINNILPILDISYKMLEDDESFYTGIGLSILISQKSSFGKRFLALENNPIWINLQDSNEFFSIIENFSERIRSQSNTSFSFERGIDLLITAISETKYYSKNLKLVLFSNHCSNKNIDNYFNYMENQCGLFKIYLPKLILWNLSKKEVFQLPSDKVLSCVLLFSGFSSSLIKNIVSAKREDTAYDAIHEILNTNRYQFLSDYLFTQINH
jgi:hypothetical protein